MRTEVVVYEGPDWTAEPDEQAIRRRTVRLTVSDETVLVNWRRGRLNIEGKRANQAEPDIDRQQIRLYSYPDACAAVIAAEGLPFTWPPDFETYLALPGPLLALVEKTIYRLNPHWLPEGAVTEDPKAPAPASTSASASG